ncbi:MAG: CRISPR-associated helicase Cas3', partial [Oscillospiraceae bacterium]
HIREADSEEQPLIDHLMKTAELSKVFADSFNCGVFAESCGKLHDIGKYSDKFQKRIRGQGGRCDHSTAGAEIAIEQLPFGKLAAYCIAGHHSGLLDFGSCSQCDGEGTLSSRLSSENIKKLPPYEAYKSEIDTAGFKFMPDKSFIERLYKKDKQSGFIFSFLTRMIFSCLTDADFLDTERFMNPNSARKSEAVDFDRLLKKLENKLSEFSESIGIINQKRSEILSCCIKSADSDRGIFTLTVPTGGGKTLSSMAFALKHLIRNGMRRIIYVIPYTSIIEQNAKVFSDIFGTENVLEHHSNYDFSSFEDAVNDVKKLASENWDMPIIVTTNVQFFESLFAHRTSKCRKLHNITDSVIIFDEAQMLPIDYLKPCVSAISELVRGYKCSAVLCSATQPALEGIFDENTKITEICRNTNELYNIFKRTEIVRCGTLKNEALAYEIMSLNQCLVIVNTRRHALKIFSMLSGGGAFHLSTLMCPANRKAVISQIRQRLKDGQTCRVVSTQLIEAGVDVDFPVVFRSLCGLDSLVQAAGRCNREGKLTDENGKKINGRVISFKPEDEYYQKQPASIKRPTALFEEIYEHYDDIGSPEAIRDFFEKLYYNQGKGLDSKNIMAQLNDGPPPGAASFDDCFNYNFKSVSEKFKLISDNTYSIIVPFEAEAVKLIEKLDFADSIRGVMRSLQQYTVNIYKSEFEKLNSAGKLRVISEDTAVLNSRDDYDNYKGINIDIGMGLAVMM